MSALPYIAGALGLGLFYLWYKQRWLTPPPPNDLCAQACKAAGSFCIDGGASCRATNQVLFGGIGPYWTERDRRETINDGLNGAVDIPNSPTGIGDDTLKGSGSPVNPVASKVLRYKNGCVPLQYSPGFSKCAAGTLDMYASAVDSAAGKGLGVTETNLVEVGAYVTVEERDQNVSSSTRPWTRIIKDNAMTGAFGDPATQGPYGAKGSEWWYVRGQRVTGVTGKAPRAVVMQHYAFPETARDAQIKNLTDAAAAELVDINQDPAISHTVLAVDCGTANPGFQWKNNMWVRTPVGQLDSPRPCPSTQPLTAEAHFLVGL